MKTSPNARDYDKVTLLGCIVWLIGAFFFLYEFFIRATIAPMTHLIEVSLSTSASMIALIASAYYFSYSLMQIPVGILIDKWGVRIIVTVGALLCSLGTLYFAVAPNAFAAWMGRFIMGFGSAVGFVALLTICLQWFPMRWFGLLSGMTQVLGAIGPILAGTPFALWLTYRHNDWRGVMVDVAIFGFVLSLIAFLIIRNRAAAPISPKQAAAPKISLKEKILTVIKLPQARWTALYAFLIYPTAPVVAALWGTTYLTDRGFDLVQATMINSMVWIGMAVGSPIIGWYSDYVQRRNPFMIFYPILGIVSLSLALFLPTQGYWTYIVLFFLMGVSTGGQTLSFAVMSEHTYKKSQSTAMGFNNSAVMLGATIIQATSGFIFNHIGKGGLSQPNTEINLHAFQMAIGVQLIFLAIAFIVSAFCIKETYGHHYLDNHKV